MNADQFQREFGAIEEEVEAMSKKLQHEEAMRRHLARLGVERYTPNPVPRIQFADDEACVSMAMLKGLLLLSIMFAVGFAVGWLLK